MCNTGVGLTPKVDGRVLHFESRGLYDGVSILWDEETGSYWNHITGEALTGPLRGEKLKLTNLLHMSAAEALAAHPDMDIALSDRRIRHDNLLGRMVRRMGLSDGFRATMSGEDTRRPTMDIGLGVWRDEGALRKYYPMETVVDEGRALVDRFGGRSLLVYIEPASGIVSALYTDAESVRWQEDGALGLSNGWTIRGGAVFDLDGDRVSVERPMQLFTRWYGFALAYPDPEIYGAGG